MSNDLISTVVQLRELVIKQREQYGDALLKAAELARKLDQFQLAEAIIGLRETYGLSETRTKKEIDFQVKTKVFNALKKNGISSYRQLLNETGANKTDLNRVLRQLREHDIIVYEGYGASTTYSLHRNGAVAI